MPQSKYRKKPGESPTEQAARIGKMLKKEKEEVKWGQLEKEAGKVVKSIRKDSKLKKPQRKDYHGLIKFNSKYDSKREAVEAYKRDMDEYKTISDYDKEK